MSTDNATDEPHGRSRWSCCLNIVAVGGLLLAGAVWAGHGFFAGYLDDKILVQAGTTRADLDAWLAEPVEVSPEILVEYPEEPEAVWKQKERLFSQAGKALNGRVRLAQEFVFPSRVKAGRKDSLLDYLRWGGEVDATCTEILARINTDISTETEKLRQLVADPDYRSNTRQLMSVDRGTSPWMVQRELLNFSLLSAVKGEWDECLDNLELFRTLDRVDPNYVGMSLNLSKDALFRERIMTVSVWTSDTQVLRGLLGQLEAARENLDISKDELIFAFAREPLLAKRMTDEGFLEKMPATRLEFIQASFRYHDYARWLLKRDGDNALARRMLDQDFFFTEVDLLDKLSEYGVAQRAFLPQFFLNHCTQYQRVATGQVDSVYKYSSQHDAAMLKLVKRIAVLEGETRELTKPEDFVPKYLRRFPTEPFTSAPLSLKVGVGGDVSVGGI